MPFDLSEMNGSAEPSFFNRISLSEIYLERRIESNQQNIAQCEIEYGKLIGARDRALEMVWTRQNNLNDEQQEIKADTVLAGYKKTGLFQSIAAVSRGNAEKVNKKIAEYDKQIEALENKLRVLREEQKQLQQQQKQPARFHLIPLVPSSGRLRH